MKKSVGILLAGLGLAGMVWAQGALSLTGAGATFPYPIYSKWFDVYHKAHSNIEINYQSIGSGGGIKQVTE
ncbi:MAG: substrate-binding domain-containing protein, partial [Candidatus Acidiferrum sp.]